MAGAPLGQMPQHSRELLPGHPGILMLSCQDGSRTAAGCLLRHPWCGWPVLTQAAAPMPSMTRRARHPLCAPDAGVRVPLSAWSGKTIAPKGYAGRILDGQRQTGRDRLRKGRGRRATDDEDAPMTLAAFTWMREALVEERRPAWVPTGSLPARPQAARPHAGAGLPPPRRRRCRRD